MGRGDVQPGGEGALPGPGPTWHSLQNGRRVVTLRGPQAGMAAWAVSLVRGSGDRLVAERCARLVDTSPASVKPALRSLAGGYCPQPG